MVDINGAVVLVTGANGGLGKEFVTQALARGASKVYATARHPREWDDERIVPLTLDVNDIDSITWVAERASDVTVLVNNAGVSPRTPQLMETGIAELNRVMATNFFGPVLVTQMFSPVLAKAESPAVVNVLSAASWNSVGGIYSASKAAFWSASNSSRVELGKLGIHVLGVHAGFIDTPLSANIPLPKISASSVVDDTWDALERGDYEVLVDETSLKARRELSGDIFEQYPELADLHSEPEL